MSKELDLTGNIYGWSIERALKQFLGNKSKKI